VYTPEKESWTDHFVFTFKVAIRFSLSAFMFIIHGICPLIPIPNSLNLRAIGNWANKTNFKRTTVGNRNLSHYPQSRPVQAR